MTADERIFEGLRVLDVGTFIFGPAAATVMADFGAEVIKVEAPGIGDLYRHLSTMPPLPSCEENYCWLLESRGKKSLALNLKSPEGREALYRLAATADVFVTNYQPSVLADLGIDEKEIRSRNDKIIYAHATGYGSVGAEVEKPGYDASAYWARSGLMDAVRVAGGPPAVPIAGMGDHPSAMSLFGAIMMGLYRRERTGKGTRVTTSLMANGAWANGCMTQAALCGGDPYAPPDLEQSKNACADMYQTRDGRWLLLLLLQEDADWPHLLAALDRQDLAADPRFASKPARRESSVELKRVLRAEFAKRDFDEWREILDRHRVTFGVVSRTQDLPSDEQMRANGVFVPIEGHGDLHVVASPIWVDGAAKVTPTLAPEIGEHTDEILASVGYSADEIGALRAARAVA